MNENVDEWLASLTDSDKEHFLREFFAASTSAPGGAQGMRGSVAEHFTNAIDAAKCVRIGPAMRAAIDAARKGE
jgi:DNA topoisomerase VI subunit B